MRASVAPSALARAPFAAIVGVAICFTAVSFVVRARSRAIDAEIVTMVDRAVPCARAIDDARAALRRVDANLARWDDAPSASVIHADVAVLDEAVRRVAALAPFASPPAEQRAVAASLASLEAESGAITASPHAASRARVEASRLDAALGRLFDLDAAESARLAEAIRTARREARATRNVLDACTLGLALLVAVLAAGALRRSVRALEERSTELDRFAGRVAHDVLSPLQATAIALEAARRRHPDDDTLQVMVRRGLSGIDRSRNLVDGLLELARAGAPADGAASSDVAAVVDDVIANARGEALAARIEVRADVATCRVACSEGVLTSLVSNLVRNAVKHMGDARERRVLVRARASGARCRVEIDDTGPGVPAGFEESIFEPFVRAHDDVPGVGLGLATVKRLALLHGGAVGYAAREEGGSRFWIDLPLAAPAVDVASKAHALSA